MQFHNIDFFSCCFVLFCFRRKDENSSRLCELFNLSETGCSSNFKDSCFFD